MLHSKKDFGGKSLPLKALFDMNYAHSVQMHPAFIQKSEGTKYCTAMTLVAMAMENDQWGSILKGDMDECAHRVMFSAIENQTKALANQLEIECGIHEAGRTNLTRAGPTLSSLSLRFKTILGKKSAEEGAAMIECRTSKQPMQQQTKMASSFGHLGGGGKRS